MTESRVNNSINNIVMNIVFQIFTIIISFISRVVFVRVFDANYLGINGLFSNILNVLSLAELGVGGAITYSMYKPMRENDKERLCALINYYKVLYNRIAIFVAVVGLSLIPFLDYFINMDTAVPYIKVYYIMFLANSVASYLFVYKTTIISVAQKDYKVKKYNIFFTILKFVMQILVLMIFQSFFLYTLVQVIISLINNYYVSLKAVQWFPFIKKNKYALKRFEKKEIWEKIKSMFAFQIGGVILNNTDNLLISMLVGTAIVGVYSNYALIIASVNTSASLIFLGIHSSVGNLNAGENMEKKKFIFNVLNLMGDWIYGFCSIALVVLSQDFIGMVFGDNYKLGNDILIVCVINFYIVGVLYPLFNYRTTIGLFQDTKYIMLIAALVNLIGSIVLGYKIGLFGILLATAIARLATNAWFEPYVLYKKYFKDSPVKYYIRRIENVLFVIGVIIGILWGLYFIQIQNMFIKFIIKIVVCAIIPNILYTLRYRNTAEFQYLYEILKGKLKVVKV